MLKNQQKTAVESLERLGFNQQEQLEQFLALPEHDALLAKFEVVFPQTAKPRLNTLSPQVDSAAEVDFMAAPDDKELDLSNSAELALSDEGELSPTLPVDEGLDLSDEGLSLGDAELGGGAEELDALVGADDGLGLEGMDDLSAAVSASADGTLTGLRLGEDLDELAPEVQAKMKEIDEIMEYDATRVQPSSGRDLSGDAEDAVDDNGEMDNLFAATSTEELAASDEMEKSLVFDASDDLGFAPMEENEIPVPKPTKVAAAPAAPAPVQDNLRDLAPMAETEVSFSAEAPAVAAEVPPVPQSAAKAAASTIARPPGQEEYREVVGHYNAELERLQATLNHLRSDREQLLKKIDNYEEEKIHHQRQLLNLRAELDEKKIETQLMKKRMSDDTQDLRYNLQLEQERRHIAEEKLKAQQAEMAAVQQKIRMEVRKVSGHERELEQQLELLKSDAETQIRNRDLKILELKRRLDAMEFDVENISALEKKSQENKQELEVKLDKAIRTLRAAIGILEVDDPKVAGLEKLKKSLDV